jgi:hypothetical protein
MFGSKRAIDLTYEAGKGVCDGAEKQSTACALWNLIQWDKLMMLPIQNVKPYASANTASHYRKN